MMDNSAQKRRNREINKLLTTGSSRFMDDVIKNYLPPDEPMKGRTLRKSPRGHVHLTPPSTYSWEENGTSTPSTIDSDGSETGEQDSNTDPSTESLASTVAVTNQHVYFVNDRGQWTNAATLTADQLPADATIIQPSLVGFMGDEDLQTWSRNVSNGVINKEKKKDKKMSGPQEGVNLRKVTTAVDNNAPSPPGEEIRVVEDAESDHTEPLIGGASDQFKTLQGHANAMMKSYNALSPLEHGNEFIQALGHHIAGTVTLVEALVENMRHGDSN